jgi:hypothetical protein
MAANMETNSLKMSAFIIVPIQTIAACYYILFRVETAILEGVYRGGTEGIGFFCNYSKKLLRCTPLWPIIAMEQSDIHECIRRLHELALYWLEHSPMFDEKDQETKYLKQYLEWLPGFSASGFMVDSEGKIGNRHSIFLTQSMVSEYKKVRSSSEFVCDDYMRQYRKFLTGLLWARRDPVRRMFAPEFDGLWRELLVDREVEDISQRFESLSVDGTRIKKPSTFYNFKADYH